MLYSIGRFFQLVGLLALPSAMWIAHYEQDEKKSITVAVAAILVFFIGYVLTQIGKRSKS